MRFKNFGIGQSHLRLSPIWIGWGAAAAALTPSLSAGAAEKHYGLTSFDRVELLADMEVEIINRAPVSATASGSQDGLDRLVVEARDGRLVISARKFAGDERRKSAREPVRLTVYAPKLSAVSVMGAGSLTAAQLRGQQIRIGLRGPGRVRVGDVIGDRLTVQMLGSGQMQLAGRVKQASVQLSGANHLDAAALQIDDVTLESEGAGDHRLHAVKRAHITARGVGRVEVLGRASCTVRNAGSGTVLCGESPP